MCVWTETGTGWFFLRSGKVGKEGRKGGGGGEQRWNVNADLESCFCKYERRKGLESRVMQLGRVCT